MLLRVARDGDSYSTAGICDPCLATFPAARNHMGLTSGYIPNAMALVAFRYRANVAAGRSVRFHRADQRRYRRAVNGRLCRGSYRLRAVFDYRYAVGGELLVTLFLPKKARNPVIRKC